MPTRAEFQTLADRRLEDAKALLGTRRYEGAFYLAGYAIECGLKAAVCKTLQIDIFDMENDLHKGFKTHRLDHLIILAGLSKQLAVDSARDYNLSVAQNSFVNKPANVDQWSSWSEQTRYNVNVCAEAVVRDFIQNVEIFLTWLRTHW